MSLRIEILRPDDLLSLTIEVHNLELDFSGTAGPRLVRVDSATPAYLVAHFPPQSFAEEALHEGDAPGDSEPPVTPGDLRSAISGTSRLAFRVPSSIESIPYTLEGLLDWSLLTPSLSRAAAIEGEPSQVREAIPITEPAPTETSLEMPYRLMISPGPAARWRHPSAPVRLRGRTELWHTRAVKLRDSDEPAGGVVELGPNAAAEIRAIWSPDYGSGAKPPGPITAMTPTDRHELVRLTATFMTALAQRGANVGRPALARRLMLSSLGGSIEAFGSWVDKPADISLIGWEHRAALGRDSYVKIVHQGRLYPLMHRASRITITERRFEMSPPGVTPSVPTAYLRQYEFITPIEREVSYVGEPYTYQGREMPLTKIRINTAATPKLSRAEPIVGTDPRNGQTVFTGCEEIRFGGALFPFSFTATDIEGNSVNFTAGQLFVPDGDNPTSLDIVARHYRNLGGETKAPVAGNRVALASPEPGSETTTFVASALRFDAQLGGGTAGFRPFLASADVRVPALEAINGLNVATQIEFFDQYLLNGFDANTGIFASVSSGKLGVEFAADQTGGFARPDLSVRGFSRGIGPVAGDLEAARQGRLNPTEAFESSFAKLFGAIPLSEIISGDGIREVSPRITTQRTPTAVETALHWSLEPKQASAKTLNFKPLGTAELTIDAVVRQPVDAEASTAVTGTLSDFSIELTGVLQLDVRAFTFESRTGQQTSVSVALAGDKPIKFRGALEFLHKIAEALPPGIFGDNGPRITIAPDHVAVGFSVGLPPAALGIFTLRHIAVSTALRLPFLTGCPSFSVAFASREKPFELAVALLGGGGFARVETDTEAVRVVEAMLEFGGLFAYDLGVASGSVHSMTGIYLALRAGTSELTGFVSVGGEMTILCIVSASVEFNISLSYYDRPPTVKGAATVSVSVSIAFISKSVSFTVEKSFSAGSEHISIGQLMTPADWGKYAEAFA